MLWFEVQVNQQTPIIASAGEGGVITAIVTYVDRDDADAPSQAASLDLSGLRHAADGVSEHAKWLDQVLGAGDAVTIRLRSSGPSDAPASSRREDPFAVEKAKRDYVRAACKEWGWELVEKA